MDARERDLVESHLGFAYSIASHYSLPGQSAADVRQEAAIALIIASRIYRPEVGTFTALSATVVRRRLYDLMTFEQRDRRRANHLTIQDMPLEDSDGDSLLAALPDPLSDPADITEARERFRGFVAAFMDLTPMERDALVMMYDGHVYSQRPDRKRIDNAIQRARQKLREAA